MVNVFVVVDMVVVVIKVIDEIKVGLGCSDIGTDTCKERRSISHVSSLDSTRLVTRLSRSDKDFRSELST